MEAIRTNLQEILYLRTLYLKENNVQIRYNARHERGWTDSYLLLHQGKNIGYAAVAGMENHDDRDTVFECYILPPFRSLYHDAFLRLLEVARPTFMEAQSNDLFTTSLLYQYCRDVHSDVILFEDDHATNLVIPHSVFRKREEGDYVLELDGEVVANGNFLLHYNKPFADIYMEVAEGRRRAGLGSYLVQEIKTQCYLNGRVPAARCNIENPASRATLLKAGFRIAGFMLAGKITSPPSAPETTQAP